MRTAFKSSFLYMMCQFSYAFADPAGGVVQRGDATISGEGSSQVVITQNSNKAIINWQTFDVGAGESVQFKTPGANAATLNRVVGGNASQILGSIKSNGQVWLINSNGIMFGQNAQIDVAGLVASTMNITNHDFMTGNYTLAQNGSNMAQIVNQGHIHADGGFVAMLAPEVENTGVIEANLGTVAIGTGTHATLNFSGNKLLNFTVNNASNVPMYDTNGNPIANLKNAGMIEANGGQVLLNAGSMNDILDESINMTGVIVADEVQDQPGKIVLIASGQTILNNATVSAQNGKVEVIGQDVGLFGNTSIHAKGGEIRVGRDVTDPNAYEADATVIGSNVALNANFVETSGNYLSVQSSHIIANQWLLDPYDLTISDANHAVTPVSPFEPTGRGSTLSVATLLSALGTGNVTVQTARTSGGDDEDGDISILSSIIYGGTNSLILDAAGAVSFDSSAVLSLGGALNITAGGDITQQGAVISVAGATTLSSGGNITLNANDANDFNTVRVVRAHNVYLKDKNDLTLGNTTVTGLINVLATGDLTQDEALVSTSPSIGTDYEVNLTAGGKITQNGSITTGDGGDIQLASGGDLIQSAGASLTSGDRNQSSVGINLDSYVGNIVQAGQITLNGAQLDIAAHAGNVTQALTAGIASVGVINVTGNNNYLDGGANSFTGVLNLNSNGSEHPMKVSITNNGYEDVDLNNSITINNSLNSFALNLPNYNLSSGNDTLSAFVNERVLTAVATSSTFDLSLILPVYSRALQVGDDTSATNLINLTQLLYSTPDTLHNLTVQTVGDIDLVYNNTTPGILTANNVDLESTGGNVRVETKQADNVMQINGGLTTSVASGGTITVSGNNSTSQIQTPTLNTITDGGGITLQNLTGVDGGSFALNMTENSNALPNWVRNVYDGVATFNQFTLTLPGYNAADDTGLKNFLNGFILNNVASAQNFKLSLNLPTYAGGINIGSHGDITLASAINDLSVQSAGNITVRNRGVFTANTIELASTGVGATLEVENDPGNTNYTAVNQSITLSATGSSSAILVEGNNSIKGIETPQLNITANNGAITLNGVSPNSSFALDLTESSTDPTALSSLAMSDSGKLDKFTLTAENYNPGSSTTLVNLLNSVVSNEAKPSAFDLTLTLSAFTPSLDLGFDVLHDLSVSTAGNIVLSPTGTLQANKVDLSTTGAHNITLSNTNASEEVSLSTGSGALLVSNVQTPIVNTTSTGGSIALDHVRGSGSTAFALNMTENGTDMPNLSYDSTPALSSFSLTAPAFNSGDGTLEEFLNTDIIPNIGSASTFNLTLNLSADTNTIVLGGGDGDIRLLNLHDLEIDSAGDINVEAQGGSIISANNVTLNTTGAGKNIFVNAASANDRILLASLNTTTNGGSVTLENGNTAFQTYALNMTELSNVVPDLIFGGTAPKLLSFSLTAPNYNQSSTNLAGFINTKILPNVSVPSNFNLTLNLPTNTYAIKIGNDIDDHTGDYIDLSTSPLLNTIGNVTIKSAGDINFTNISGSSIYASSIDLETSGLGSRANITAVNAGDAISVITVSDAITLKALGIAGAVSVGSDAEGFGSITTPVVNLETNQGTSSANGVTSDFALSLTEDSDATPNFIVGLDGVSLNSLTVTLPNYNLGNDISGNNSLTTWMNLVLSTLPVQQSGFSLSVNTPLDGHTIQMGYDENDTRNFINLYRVKEAGHTRVTEFGNLSLKSAGDVDLLANGTSITANSADLETTGLLSNVNVQVADGNAVTLNGDTPLTLAAKGGGNISVNTGENAVSAATVNTISTGGGVDLTSVTGTDAGTSGAYTLNMTDNSGWIPTLQTSNQLKSFTYTAPNLSWNVNEGVESLLNTVLSNKTANDPGSNFNLTWNTTGLRDVLDMAAVNETGFLAHNMTLNSRGAIELGAVTVRGDLTVGNSVGFQDITESLQDGNLEVTHGTTILNAGGDITLMGNNNFNGGKLTLTGQDIAVTDNATVLGLGGVIASGSLVLIGKGGINQYEGYAIDMSSGTTGANTASFEVGSGGPGDILLNQNNNFNQNAVSVSGAGNVTINDVNSTALVLGSVAATGTATLTSAGSMTDGSGHTGSISAATSNLTAVSGIALTNSANRFGTVSADSTGTGDITLADGNANGLTVAGMTAHGNVNLAALADDAPITVLGAINASNITVQTGGQLNLTVSHAINATGNAILSGGLFNNTGGSEAVATGGFWNIYLASSIGNTYDGLTSSGTVWNTPYNPPESAPTSNLYLYATANPTPVPTPTTPSGGPQNSPNVTNNPAIVQQTIQNSLPQLNQNGQLAAPITQETIQNESNGVNPDLED